MCPDTSYNIMLHLALCSILNNLWFCFQVAIKFYKQPKRSLTPALHAQIEEFFQERHGDYAGWAQLYLFYSNVTNKGSHAVNPAKAVSEEGSEKKNKAEEGSEKKNKAEEGSERKSKRRKSGR